MNRWAVCILSVLLTGAAGGAGVDELPQIGSPANEVITPDDEYRIGMMIIKGLRDAGQIYEDPELTEYVQTLGSRLASHAQEGTQRFHFFIIKDSRINAFALPGGFICVNAGLVLATVNESELAGVLAHEIAHVTQRHIARTIQQQGRSNLMSAAAVLAAILIGAAIGGGGDAMTGAIAAAQGISAQQQLNFSRAAEYEADRVGIGTLAAAGFDPNGMPSFFETLQRHSGLAGSRVPEMLQSHPVTSNRIAEARSRARQMDVKREPDTLSYSLSRERLRVLTIPEGTDPHKYYDALLENDKAARDDSHQYGRALALMASKSADDAIPILAGLIQRNPSVMQYRSALGEAQMLAGYKREAMDTFEHALQLFPRNVPLAVHYAEALLRGGEPRRAHEILLDLFNNVAPTPEQARLIAIAANSAGDVADAYYYMSEYHVISGDLMLAMNQLQLALAVPGLSEVQRARFQARLDQLREYVPREGARVAERDGEPPRQEPPRDDPSQRRH
jgi:predicted Zn-dependent protease